MVGDSAPTLLILISVGMLVGIWIIGGTVPALLYYGLKLCSPTIIVPLTFVLCGVTSLFTGTSFGSIATMGLAFYGVGLGMGIPAPLMAGAVCAGAFFGDKMSPLSDTTNVAAVMSGTDLYDHIGSMLRTTVPAALIALVIYAVLGVRYAGGAVNMDDINLMIETLDNTFNITPGSLWAPGTAGSGRISEKSTCCTGSPRLYSGQRSLRLPSSRWTDDSGCTGRGYERIYI